MHDDLETFLVLLAGCCSQIGRDYFELPQADGDAVYRERVYCYELYHQMRSRWGEFRYSLAGEIDKSGHPIFRGGPYAQAKPDFLVHIPGDMRDNLAIVEVKAASASLAELLADIDKLSWFCGEHARYYAGILLVYGAHKTFQQCQHRLVEAIREIDGARIVVVHHATVGEMAQTVFSQ